MSTESRSKPPTHGIYITPEQGRKGRWQKIGAGWLHKDAKGITLIFDALPVSGRATLRLIEAATEETDEAFNEAANGGQQ